MIDAPEVSLIPELSELGQEMGFITHLVTAQEHTVCLTDLGQVLVCGSNMHQKLGIDAYNILFN